MARSRTISEFVVDTEATLAKYKAVQAAFPNARCNYYMEFSDKSVNQLYTHFTFETQYGLYVLPYCEVLVEHNGQEEYVKVHSMPKRNRLAYLTYEYPNKDYSKRKNVMKFSRMAINMKNNKFREDMLNSCKAEIMNFIKNNPGYELDTKHLEPRLKKLILFT